MGWEANAIFLAGGTKWGRNFGGARSGAASATCLEGRAQRWAVSAASTWRGARPGPCPHHAWAVERSDGLCRPPACGAERGQGPCPHHAWWVAYSEGCVRPACGAERGQGAVSASCLGVAYSEGCVRPAWRSRERPVSAKVSCVSLWVASRRTALLHVGSRQGGDRSGVAPPFGRGPCMRRGFATGSGILPMVVVRGFWAAERGQGRLSGPPVGPCQLIPHFSEVTEAWAVEHDLGGSESP